jgi:hypothetical protein
LPWQPATTLLSKVIAMSTLLITGFIVLFLGMAGYLLYWVLLGPGKTANEHQLRLKAERGRWARQQGWQYEEVKSGDIAWRMHGTSAQGTWTIEYDTDASSSSSTPKLNWRMPGPARGQVMWAVMDVVQHNLMTQSAVGSVLRGIVGLLGAKDETEFLRSARPQALPAAGGAFNNRFVLLARRSGYSDLIDAQVAGLFLHWPAFETSFSSRDNALSARQDAQGVSVRLACDGPDFAVIAHLAELGNTLAQRLPKQF